MLDMMSSRLDRMSSRLDRMLACSEEGMDRVVGMEDDAVVVCCVEVVSLDDGELYLLLTSCGQHSIHIVRD